MDKRTPRTIRLLDSVWEKLKAHASRKDRKPAELLRIEIEKRYGKVDSEPAASSR